MKIHELVECAECREVDAPTQFGRCSTCGSLGVTWLSQLRDGVRVLQVVKREEPRPCGIDREFLREMGVSA